MNSLKKLPVVLGGMGQQENRMEAKKEDLVLDHLLFIKSIAFKYAKGDDDRANDLVTVGVIGFLESFKRFDPSRGWKLSSYACECAKFKILEHIRRTAYRGLGWKYKDMSTVALKLSKEDTTNWKTKNITSFARANKTTVRIVETLLGTKSCDSDLVEGAFCNVYSPAKSAEMEELTEHVQQFSDSLSEDDREVFNSVVFNTGTSLNELGRRRGVSLSRKSAQIQKDFFEAMKGHRRA